MATEIAAALNAARLDAYENCLKVAMGCPTESAHRIGEVIKECIAELQALEGEK